MGHPTCAAIHCSHTSKQCKMKTFPRNERRAKIWERNMCRANWERKPFHRLCACHFDESQFEKHGITERRKLRQTAVPLIFPTHNLMVTGSPTFRPNCNRKLAPALGEPLSLELLKSSQDLSSNTKTSQPPKVGTKSVAPSSTLILPSPDTVKSYSSSMTEKMKGSVNMRTSQSLRNHHQKSAAPKVSFILPKTDIMKSSAPIETTTGLSGVFYVITPLQNTETLLPVNEGASIIQECVNQESSSDEMNQLKRERDDLRRETYRLSKKLTTYSKILRRFNDDELVCLAGKKVKKWSDETYNKCLETRLAVGKKGYDFLLRKGYPLVSYASLCRYIQILSEEKELSQNVASDLVEEVSSFVESPRSFSSDCDSNDESEDNEERVP